MSAEPTPIAVLASGRGSNFGALVRAIRAGRLPARIVALVCDRPGAPVLEAAREAGVEALTVPPPSSEISVPERRLRHERKILDELSLRRPRFLVMAGYMRVVTRELLDAFRSEKGYTRVTNVHPSLLPAFPGVGSYGQAFRHGCKVAGVTVHLVEEEVDAGPICAQEAFAIDDLRSPEEVEHRGLGVEHRLYPETLRWVLAERFEVEKREGRLCVSPN